MSPRQKATKIKNKALLNRAYGVFELRSSGVDKKRLLDVSNFAREEDYFEGDFVLRFKHALFRLNYRKVFVGRLDRADLQRFIIMHVDDAHFFFDFFAQMSVSEIEEGRIESNPHS